MGRGPRDAEEPSTARSSTVLFVGGERSAALAVELEQASEASGFRLERRVVGSSTEALDALAQAESSFAIVDLTTHGSSGAEAWRRTRDVWSRPVAVLHAEGDDACARAALADGAEEALDVLDPAAVLLLLRAIERAFARGRDDRPEVELRKLQDRWRALDGANRWYVMEIDDADRITYLNRPDPAAPPMTIVGRSVFDFTHPDAHDDVRGRLQHVRRTGQPVTVEERGHGTVGDDTWFVARCLPMVRDGRVTSILVVTEDVSDRHRMQKLIANSERRFRALVEKASDAIVLLDREGRATYASPATERLLGFAPEEVVTRDFLTFVHPDDVASVLAARSALREAPGTQVTNDVRLRHKDGGWRLVHGIGTNLFDDPAVGAVVGNYRDVTAERALEDQVRRAQQWKAIALLAGGIAHDFNNLLGVIMTAASSAVSAAPPGGEEAGALEDIQQAASRAAELTRKLLALGRTQPLAMEYLDAGELIAEFASLLRRTLGEGVEVEVTCKGKLPVRVDRIQIEQVLLNVCTNARQAMQGHGRVRIKARSTEGAGGAPVVEIVVHDDGPGMDEPTRSRVFEPYFTTKDDGSGLGLTVSYGIVQRHGGSMRIDSVPGQGTAVTIELPLQDGPRSEKPPRSAPSPGVVRGARILVAEDESTLRRVICRVLRAKGYEVVEAEDGDTAVGKFSADRAGIALVVMDVRMPGVSGPAAYERMARERADLPVVFVTGHAPDSEMIPRGARLLVKPFTNDALLRAVLDATAGSAEA